MASRMDVHIHVDEVPVTVYCKPPRLTSPRLAASSGFRPPVQSRLTSHVKAVLQQLFPRILESLLGYHSACAGFKEDVAPFLTCIRGFVPEAVLEHWSGGGRFEAKRLRPVVTTLTAPTIYLGAIILHHREDGNLVTTDEEKEDSRGGPNFRQSCHQG